RRAPKQFAKDHYRASLVSAAALARRDAANAAPDPSPRLLNPPSRPPSVLLVVALDLEAAPFRRLGISRPIAFANRPAWQGPLGGCDVTLLVSGMGPEAARATLRRALANPLLPDFSAIPASDGSRSERSTRAESAPVAAPARFNLVL